MIETQKGTKTSPLRMCKWLVLSPLLPPGAPNMVHSNGGPSPEPKIINKKR